MSVIGPCVKSYNEPDGVSNYQRLHCLLNCWFRRRSKKTPKLRVTGLCVGNSLCGEFTGDRWSCWATVLIQSVLLTYKTCRCWILLLICNRNMSMTTSSNEAFSALLALFRGIHRSPVNSPHKGPAMRYLIVFYVGPHELLNKQSNDRWSETTWHSCDVIVMVFIDYSMCVRYHIWGIRYHIWEIAKLKYSHRFK